MDKATILNTFHEAVEKPQNAGLAQWVAQGGRVIGYYCSLIPGEIITAAGMMPYRIRGASSTDTSLADTYLSTYLCSFVRHTVNMALQGHFDFISGIVATNGCDQARRAFDVWEKKKLTPFTSVISVPRSAEENNMGYFVGELQRLIEALEAHFNVEITSDKLRQAVALHNSVRHNLARLHHLRKGPRPPVTGTQAATITLAAHVMPLAEYNQLLESLLEVFEADDTPGPFRARLIVSGGELDEPGFIKAIEEQGGLVVYEDTCFGARYYEQPVAEEGDPLTNIAERYLFRLPCARTDNSFAIRYDNLETIRSAYQADGLIVQRLNHCLLNSGHAFLFRQKSKLDDTIPILLLDREYQSPGAGQANTRIQAFIERIESMA